MAGGKATLRDAVYKRCITNKSEQLTAVEWERIGPFRLGMSWASLRATAVTTLPLIFPLSRSFHTYQAAKHVPRMSLPLVAKRQGRLPVYRYQDPVHSGCVERVDDPPFELRHVPDRQLEPALFFCV
jgi:hypothetical protein